MTGVKICGITSRADAELAAEAGARYLGAVFYPASPRNVTAEAARAFSDGLPADLVIVVADEPVSRVTGWAEAAGAAVIQLHGTEPPEDVAEVASAGPWRVWKAVRARTPAEVLDAVDRYRSVVDGLLVDGWHPDRIGGSGVRVAWDDLPPLGGRLGPGCVLVAAGGLTAENVAGVMALAAPDVVDVSSGVERAPGVKDAARVRAFVDAVTRADAGRNSQAPNGR